MSLHVTYQISRTPKARFAYCEMLFLMECVMFYIIFTISQIRIIVIIIIVCNYNIGIMVIETPLIWTGIAYIHILR